MRQLLAYIALIGLVLLVVGGAAELSIRSSTCMACHGMEASFARWMTGRLKAEKKGFGHELIACADCHIKGAPARTALSRLRGLLHTVTYLVPQIDPRKPEVTGIFTRTRIPSENCQYCHLASLNRKAVYVKDLPAGLKKIGLTMDHRKHVLTRDDTCARCHERYKADDKADKGVNYLEVNHLACDSCHSMASHSYRADRLLPMNQPEYLTARETAWKTLSTNPRWMVAMPSEKSCRRCHNGKIHFKTRIFLANCREGNNYDTCVKCHPIMTKDYFEQYKRERKKSRLASGSAGNEPPRQSLTAWKFDGAEHDAKRMTREP